MIPQAEEKSETSSTAEILPLITKQCKGCEQPFTYVPGSRRPRKKTPRKQARLGACNARDVRQFCDTCHGERKRAQDKASAQRRADRQRANSCPAAATQFSGRAGSPHAVCTLAEAAQLLRLDEIMNAVQTLEREAEDLGGEETLERTSALLAELDQIEKGRVPVNTVKALESRALAKLRCHPFIAMIYAEENPPSPAIQQTRDYFLNKSESRQRILKEKVA